LLPGHHGYPRASDLIRYKALKGRKYIKITDATVRPFLQPYPSLALFAVPVVLLEPVKPVAAYLLATGSVSAGMTVLIAGELLKLVIIERLFKMCRLKLLKIPVFAWGYRHWRDAINWIVSMQAWQAARLWIRLIRGRVQKYLMQI
jgi:hypothetical protein